MANLEGHPSSEITFFDIPNFYLQNLCFVFTHEQNIHETKPETKKKHCQSYWSGFWSTQRYKN